LAKPPVPLVVPSQQLIHVPFRRHFEHVIAITGNLRVFRVVDADFAGE
jgi:hypothetical protein